MSPLSQILTRRYLPALDGLRAVSVAIVVVYHAGADSVPGDLGVTGFFVLSGFLITWLLIKEQSGTGQVDLKAFYIRRSLRIFPAYFALVLGSLGADYLLSSPWEPGRVLAALTYTLNYHNALFGHEGPIAHGWSLAIEEQFYLLWPAAFLWLTARGRLRTGLLVLIVGVLGWRSLAYLGGASEAYVYNAFETRFDALAIGCLLAVLCLSSTFLDNCRSLARPWAPLVTAALIYLVRAEVPDLAHYTFGFSLEALLVAVLIVQLLQVSESVGWRWLNHPLARWFGALSYPLYLWHIWGLAAGGKLPFAPPVQVAAGIGISIILASLSFYVVEQPFMRLKARLGSPAKTAAPAVRKPSPAPADRKTSPAQGGTAVSM